MSTNDQWKARSGPVRPARWIRFVVRRRWLILWTSAVAFVLLLAGGRHLGMRGDYRVFFSDDNPELAAFEAFQATFTRDDGLLIVVRPQDRDVFGRETLEAVARLTDDAWRLPFVTRVDSITNFQEVHAAGDDLIVEDLVGDATAASRLDAAALADLRARALGEPRLVRRLVSADGAVTAVHVTLHIDGGDPRAFDKIAVAVRALAAETEARHPSLAIDLTGIVMLNHAFLEATLRDMQILMPWVLIAIVGLTALFLRSAWATAAMTVVVLGSAVGGMGAAGWIGIELTAPSALAPTLIMTLAVAAGMHLTMAVRTATLAGKAGDDAVAYALARHVKPIFLTSGTTAIGFWSMRASEAPPCRDLGTITALGVVVAFVATVTTLPALLATLPVRFASSGRSNDLGGWLAGWAARVIRRPKAVLAIGSLLVVAVSAGMARNVLDDRFVEYFDHRIPFRGASERTMADLTGLYQVEYALPAATAGGIADPAYLRTVDRFARWWRRQPEVVHVRTLVDTISRLNQALHGDDPAFAVVPSDRRLAAENLLLYELSLPFGLDLNNEIDIDKSASRVTVTVGDVSAATLRELAARGEAWLATEAPTMVTPGVGPAVMFAHLTKRSIESMLTSTFLALLVISACLVVALRSVRFGLLSAVPNLLPAAVGFGLWGLWSGQVGFGLSIVSAMTLGIVVDDTVHMLSRYLDARRHEGLEPEAAIVATVRTVGPALVATTAVLTIGFGLLATSPFAQNSDMGRLSAIVLVVALLADLVLLPALLMVADRGTAKRRGGPEGERTSGVPVRAARAAAVAMTLVGPIWLLVDAGRLEAEDDEAARRGYEIAQEVDRRDSGFGDMAASLEMVLTDRQGRSSRRQLRTRVLEVADDGDKSVILFDEPADVRGTALLTHSHTDGQDDQWLYLPSVKRVKRIASGRRTGPFLGSEFSFEDLSSQELEEYRYRFLRDEACGDADCFVIERISRDPASGYEREEVWIDREHHRIHSIAFYDRTGEALKRLTFEGYTQHGVEGGPPTWWRPTRMEMINLRTGKRTELLWRDYRFGIGQLDVDFDQGALSRLR